MVAQAEEEAAMDEEVEVEEEDEELEMQETRPAVEAEMEQDDASQGLKPVGHVVSLNKCDATPDVFFSGAGDVVSSLSQGAFRHLLSAIRADTGVKAGRYLFEVTVLEQVPAVRKTLRVGFSTARSSLFLGDGSLESVAFGSEGSYFSAEPGQLRPREVSKACEAFAPQQVIGVLLNLAEGSNANTVSVFIDGIRASRPQPLPVHLQGKALFPTITFQNMTLSVNFGRCGQQLRALPFRCRMFADLAEEHHEQAQSHTSKAGSCEVVMPVGLPDSGVYDWVDRFLEEHPNFLELSERYMEEWCVKSGLTRKKEPGEAHSRDEPDFSLRQSGLEDKSWWATLLHLAKLGGRSCVFASVRSGLLEAERRKLLQSFPSAKKVAAVIVGKPDSNFRDWVHGKIRSDFDARKRSAEQRRMLAEASGEELTAEELKVPEAPTLDESVWLLPRTKVPDMAEKSLASAYAKFSLPSRAEGFDEIRYEWQSEEEAREKLRKWVLERKARLVVDDLRPGAWFKSKLEAWKEARKSFRQGQMDFSTKSKEDATLLELASTLSLANVEDAHNADGKGVPVYANFKYEDWLILSWRYELHLLSHAFLIDVADPDRPGIPEDHVAHYFRLYLGQAFEPRQRLGVAGLPEALKLLKEPLELVETDQGYRILKSQLDKDESLDAFAVSVESYRRDRTRRVEAGDESAQLSLPRPAAKQAPKKAAAPVKAKPLSPVAKTPAPKAVKPVVKAPAPKASVVKAPPVAKVPPQGVKRPLEGAGSGAGDAKRLRPDAAPAPVVKRPPITKQPPITKRPPITKAPPSKQKA
eukprot:TRINITY_DN110274_c0_g1_i1.p1 TRINITY_DN110274_c0_g1~~TRINITY_DN110274_c0_g1_i1.p1  ORF type:complete len:809 (+),score=207.76 TRINITY_DN110274_c0_g1_i1:48-2474(+)